MKILFDQNISFRVANKLIDLFNEAKQVKSVGLENATDLQIWQFAKKNGYTIVTFDSDFYDIANLKGHPPKIIWLRTGNRNTESLIGLFREKHEIIDQFINHDSFGNSACLEIND